MRTNLTVKGRQNKNNFENRLDSRQSFLFGSVLGLGLVFNLLSNQELDRKLDVCMLNVRLQSAVGCQKVTNCAYQHL